jgi:hypothetical protein
MMKRYRIKSDPSQEAYFDVLEEHDDGCRIRLTRLYDGYEKTADEFIKQSLFEMCLSTGYIYEDPAYVAMGA